MPPHQTFGQPLDPTQGHRAHNEHLRLFELGLLVLARCQGRHVQLVVLSDLGPVGRLRNLGVREGNGGALHSAGQVRPDVLGGRRVRSLGRGESDFDDDDALDVGTDPVAAVGFGDLQAA